MSRERFVEPPVTARSHKEGTVLNGRYRLGRAVGAGNYGAVYRAMHLALGQPVAVKILTANIAGDATAMERFRREAITTRQVQHANAVSVLDFDLLPDGTPFMVMELLEGRSLRQELAAVGGRVSVRRTVEILVPVCQALAVAHAVGIVHRDVKPANVFLHRAPSGREVVKLLDFGVAKISQQAGVGGKLTAHGAVLGTPGFIAPERLQDKPYDGRNDVYSVGAMAFLMLSGRLPFESPGAEFASLLRVVTEDPPRLKEISPEVPRALDALVNRCLSRAPERRPGAADLAAELGILDAAPSVRSSPAMEAIAEGVTEPELPSAFARDPAVLTSKLPKLVHGDGTAQKKGR